MYFRDIVGQERIKDRLRAMADGGAVPHALLFAGPEGTGKLQTAVAFSRYLLCRQHHDGDSCGQCPTCVKIDKQVHPDLHYVYPVINKKKSGEESTVSTDELVPWRECLIEKRYFGYEEWLSALGGDNKQAHIFVSESTSISQALSLKSVEDGFKIMIIWHPEKMNLECANSLLKLLEEPPAGTIFILVSDNPGQLLETIISRCQRIDFPPIPEAEISQRLMGPGIGLQADDARRIAHLSAGSWLKAMASLRIGQESEEFLDFFMQLMRFAYARRLKDLKLWSDAMATRPREWQKRFLEYCQRMVRENFIQNFHMPELNYMTEREQTFSNKFSPFVNENNIFGLVEELQSAQRDIEQNVNSKMVFFDLAVKTIMLMKQ